MWLENKTHMVIEIPEYMKHDFFWKDQILGGGGREGWGMWETCRGCISRQVSLFL